MPFVWSIAQGAVAVISLAQLTGCESLSALQFEVWCLNKFLTFET